MTNYRVVLNPYIPKFVTPYKDYTYDIGGSYDADGEIKKVEWTIKGKTFL
jgi:hypothetical protein